MTRVPVKPELIEWAIERSRRDPAALSEKFAKLDQWLAGDALPTLKQLESFAAATHTPFGYFFLPAPPAEPLPIPDFRTLDSAAIARPSPDLLDTIYLCQQRQDWYRTNAQILREEAVTFVGSVTTQRDPVRTADSIRKTLALDMGARAEARTFEDALRMMISAADAAGVLVMVSGVVGGNGHRRLDVDEFRGFALADDAPHYAPLVFINGADTKSGQMFTLAHELAHLWLGQSALTDATAATIARDSHRRQASEGSEVETWCNAVAAEVLVPMESFRVVYRPGLDVQAEKLRLSGHYKASTLVILRRMLDAGGLTRDQFRQVYEAEVRLLRDVMARRREAGGGGDFYATTKTRVSPRLARSVLAATWEGRATFTEAFRMLGCRNVQTLERLGAWLGMENYLVEGAV